MSLEIEATYENGILKLDEPLPLKEHERVIVTVQSKASRNDDHEQMLRRGQSRERLLNLFARVDEKTKHIPDEEIDAAIEEAMQFVRGGRGG